MSSSPFSRIPAGNYKGNDQLVLDENDLLAIFTVDSYLLSVKERVFHLGMRGAQAHGTHELVDDLSPDMFRPMVRLKSEAGFGPNSSCVVTEASGNTTLAPSEPSAKDFNERASAAFDALRSALTKSLNNALSRQRKQAIVKQDWPSLRQFAVHLSTTCRAKLFLFLAAVALQSGHFNLAASSLQVAKHAVLTCLG